MLTNRPSFLKWCIICTGTDNQIRTTKRQNTDKNKIAKHNRGPWRTPHRRKMRPTKHQNSVKRSLNNSFQQLHSSTQVSTLRKIDRGRVGNFQSHPLRLLRFIFPVVLVDGIGACPNLLSMKGHILDLQRSDGKIRQSVDGGDTYS